MEWPTSRLKSPPHASPTNPTRDYEFNFGAVRGAVGCRPADGADCCHNRGWEIRFTRLQITLRETFGPYRSKHFL